MAPIFMDVWTCRKRVTWIAIADFSWCLLLTLVNLIILIEYHCFIEENLLHGWLRPDVTLLVLILLSSFALTIQLLFTLRLHRTARHFESSPGYCASAARMWIIAAYIFLGLQVAKILTLLVLLVGGSSENGNALRKWVFILLSCLEIAFRATTLPTVKLFYEKHVSMVQTEGLRARRGNAAVFNPLSAEHGRGGRCRREEDEDPSPY